MAGGTTNGSALGPSRPESRDRWIGRVIAMALGILHTLTAIAHESMNPDGIAYLDMGDAWFRGDWPMALNAYWSPLYGWILGAVLHLGGIGPEGEFAAVQWANLAIYLGALVAFEFFWRALERPEDSAGGLVGIPRRAFWALGYALFVVSSLQMIRVWSVTPDMCVAACVYLAAGLLLRWSRGAPSRSIALAFGAVLGLGYLAKAAMFPLALAFFAAALVARADRRSALRALLFGVAAFLVVAGPFVVALSLDEDRATFGDSGRLNYVWFVNRIPYPHWVGGEQAGPPTHPTRRVSNDPPVYEFAEPVGGTYAAWYDPPYWFDGVQPRFDLRQQTGVLAVSALDYGKLFFGPLAGLCFIVLLLYGVAAGQGRTRSALLAQLPLLLPAVAALSMYGLVLVEERYIGPFVVLLWAGLLSGLRLAQGRGSRRLLRAAGWTMVLSLAVWVLAFNVDGLRPTLQLPKGAPTAARATTEYARSRPASAALGLQDAGLRPGDRIGIVGYGFDAFWARIARVRIVAELYPWDAPDFWDPAAESHARVLDAFAAAGVRAVVAESVPPDAAVNGWQRVGSTHLFIRFLAD